MKHLNVLLCTLLLLSFSGCAAAKRNLDSLPTTFLQDTKLSEKKQNLPFDHSWADPSAHWGSYTSVFIKPVRTDLLEKDAWEESISVAIISEEGFIEETNNLAKYFREQLLSEIKERQGKSFANIVETPDANTLVLEFAFTEIEFSHPLQKIGALVVPIPGSGQVANALSDPFVTFALRVTDGATHKLLATAADRKFSPRRIINFNKMTAVSANREICQIWAEEIAETLASGGLAEVEGVNWRWLPW